MSNKLNIVAERAAADPDGYGMWREYKLWELDGTNVKIVTGLSYDGLRQLATCLGDQWSMQMYKQQVKVQENQNNPYWDTVLTADARSVWNWRRRNNMRPLGPEYFEGVVNATV